MPRHLVKCLIWLYYVYYDNFICYLPLYWHFSLSVPDTLMFELIFILNNNHYPCRLQLITYYVRVPILPSTNNVSVCHHNVVRPKVIAKITVEKKRKKVINSLLFWAFITLYVHYRISYFFSFLHSLNISNWIGTTSNPWTCRFTI